MTATRGSARFGRRRLGALAAGAVLLAGSNIWIRHRAQNDREQLVELLQLYVRSDALRDHSIDFHGRSECPVPQVLLGACDDYTVARLELSDLAELSCADLAASVFVATVNLEEIPGGPVPECIYRVQTARRSILVQLEHSRNEDASVLAIIYPE